MAGVLVLVLEPHCVCPASRRAAPRDVEAMTRVLPGGSEEPREDRGQTGGPQQIIGVLGKD